MQLTSLLGRKLYQKQAFLQDGTRVPLSGIRVLGNVIAQVKSADKEGYNALQLGIETKKRAKKSLANHSKKAGLTNTPAFLREVRVDDVEGAVAGTEINAADVFAVGDIVDVVGISKGKGFAGGVKRWGFKGGPRTHGQSDRERAPGSIGQTTTPGRVYRGKRMAGRMGQETVTVQNLEVVEITNDGILLVKGLIPGSVNTIVAINKMGVNKKFVPLYKETVEGVSEEAQSESAGDQTHPLDDAQAVPTETQASDTPSLNENQSEKSNEDKKDEAQLVSDSPQDGSVTGATKEDVEAPVEVKIEASEVPPMQDEPATTIEETKEKTKIGEENAN
jgi:large subunit ribosomal protein L3